ncbi:hypothetical protein D7Z54_24165 [Salibacterium salarium]|uniref:Uncharacterized protein n=1 Tax=Salibacterium salarium TaxID=284579 RepID=A0A428MX43_9BACI|nr:hypothetical protein D7Z54_24165 [Salibacterium salarium]
MPKNGAMFLILIKRGKRGEILSRISLFFYVAHCCFKAEWRGEREGNILEKKIKKALWDYHKA